MSDYSSSYESETDEDRMICDDEELSQYEDTDDDLPELEEIIDDDAEMTDSDSEYTGYESDEARQIREDNEQIRFNATVRNFTKFVDFI